MGSRPCRQHLERVLGARRLVFGPSTGAPSPFRARSSDVPNIWSPLSARLGVLSTPGWSPIRLGPRASSRAGAPRGPASWCWFRVGRVTPCESPPRPKATPRRARARCDEAHRCRPAWRGGPARDLLPPRQLLSVPTTTSPRPGRSSTSAPIGEMERSRVGEQETASRTGTGGPGHRSRSASRHGGLERGDTLIEVPRPERLAS